MDFSSIGNINSYLKTLNMNNAWKQNMNNPSKSAISGSTSKASNETYERAASPIDDRYMSIIAKIKSGQKLSSEDMDYLREKYPADYDEVKKLDREKKEFEEDLGRCKTKSDARMLHQGKITEAFAALKGSAVSSEVIMAKLGKITESFSKFTGSKHYSELAESYMELEKAIHAKKEAVSGKSEDVEKEQKNDENNMQIESDTPELQDQSIQSGQNFDSVDIETISPQSAHGGNPKYADTGKSASAPKAKTDTILADVKPSFVPNRGAVRAKSEAYDADALVEISHNKLNRKI